MAEAFLNAEGEFPISVLEDIKYNTPGTYKYYARQTNEDGEIISTVNAMDDGMIAFDEIRFELPGTYNYTI